MIVFYLSTGQPPPSVADGTSVVTNRVVTIKKTKNLNMKIETVSDRDNRPSGEHSSFQAFLVI